MSLSRRVRSAWRLSRDWEGRNVDERSSQLSAFAQRIAARGDTSGGPEGAFDLSEMPGLVVDPSQRDRIARCQRKLLDEQSLGPEEAALYEAIILPQERPAILINQGTFETPPRPWTHLAEAGPRRRLGPAIAAVGRVEISPPGGVPYVGTAFVVGDGLLMTNRHVAAAFAEASGANIRFVEGKGANVHFAREENAPDRQETQAHQVARILMMHPYWDMALLQIPGLAIKPLQLMPIPTEDAAGHSVAVVGHPGRDSRNPADVQDRVFQRKYQVKRLQPGYVLGGARYRSSAGVRDTLAHDSSTLGGNSGSAVVRVDHGDVVGLHFAGKYRVANYAVPMFELARDPRVVDAGVNFAAGGPGQDDPWAEAWRQAPQLAASRAPSPRSMTIRIPIEITVRTGDVK